MLDKISFRSGVVLSSLFLNEVQKSPTLNYPPRADFYSVASENEENSWPVGQRDSLKDWELPDPSNEPNTTVGRFAYDGIILGCNNCSDTDTDPLELVYGPPRVSRKALVDSEILNNTGAIFVNAGTIYDSQARRISWTTTQVVITPGEENYIYLTYDYEAEINPINIVASDKLPSIATSYVPLARININNSFEIIEFEDLRPGTYIDILKPRDLSNSDIINETLDNPVQIWRRNLVDTANGEITLLLPSAKDSDRISFLDISGTFSRNNLHIITDPQSTDRIHGEYKLILDIKDSHVSLVYIESLQEWRIEDIDYSNADRDSLGEFVSCGGQYCIGITAPENCPNGAPIPPIFPEKSEGYYIYEATSDSQGKCYKVINSSWSIYSDGQGGFIQFPNEKRCGAPTQKIIDRDHIATLYVDQATGDDSYVNNGETVPFRTLERALLQAARRDKKYSIHISPGEYYVDNSPGNAFANAGDILSGFHNLLDTEINVFTFDSDTNILVLNQEEESGSQNVPPEAFQVGKTIYNSSGSVATIKKIRRKKQCTRDCGWILYLANRIGDFSFGERLYTNNLSNINSISGGIIVPHGTSIIGSDLRKTIIRPLYVPDDLQSQSVAYILKLTRDSYVKGITFSDNLSRTKTHHKLTAIGFASEEDIEDNYQYNTYYEKIKIIWNDDSLSPDPVRDELEIVAPVPKKILDKFIDLQENITGEESPDSLDPNTEGYYRYPGKIRIPPEESSLPAIPIADINSVRNSSPFVHECSLRSIFGLNGVYADGRSVRGFKSILLSGFTQVSIQIDPDAFEEDTYFSEPFSNTLPKKYKSEYRHYGFKASHDAYIQINSCFVIGNAIHFTTECGGQLTILNSVSNFGDISILPKGYCLQPLPQDIGIPSENYLGTRITQIIPPKPITGNIEEYKFNTGLAIDLGATRKYFEDNSENDRQRIYIRAYNLDNHLSLTNPPSSKLIESNNNFNYTKRDLNDEYILTTNDDKLNSIFIRGKENEIFYAKIAEINNQDNIYLDSGSRIFFWDENPQRGYESLGLIPSDINTDNKRYFYKDFNDASAANLFFDQIGELGSFLKINDNIYRIQDKYIDNNQGDYRIRFFTTEDINLDNNNPIEVFAAYSDFTGGLWYIIVENTNEQIDNSVYLFSNSENLNNSITDSKELYIHRSIDLRSDLEKIYRIKLEGFDFSKGKRIPQEHFIFEEQEIINPDIDDLNFNLDSPLVVSNIESIESEPGKFYAVLCKANEINTIVPKYSIDDPTMEEVTSSTVGAAEYLFSRDNYHLYDYLGNKISSLEENLNPYILKYKEDEQINIQLHIPSTIRSTNHSWEWIGYLNYDSSLPSLHLTQISKEDRLKKILTEENGGKGYISGMTEDGSIITSDLYNSYYISSDRINPEIPKNVNNFRELNIQYRIGLLNYSSLIFNDFSRISFSKNTLLYDENQTNLLSSDNSDYSVYASESRAGFIQLSDNIVENDTREDIAISPKRLLESIDLLTHFATDAEVIDGIETNKAITPSGLHKKDASKLEKGLVILADSTDIQNRNTNKVLTANNLNDENIKATETIQGMVTLATDSELSNRNTESVITTANLAHENLLATTDKPGLIELATETEFNEGIIANKAVSPNLLNNLKTQINVTTGDLNTLSQSVDNILLGMPNNSINNIRLSHNALDSYPTIRNTSSTPYTKIYLHGDTISLWNDISQNWEIKTLSNNDKIEFNLNEILIDSGNLIANSVYNLFLKIGISGNIELKARLIIPGSSNLLTIKDGILSDSLDISNRYVGRLLTYGINNYIQFLGGQTIDNDDGSTVYDPNLIVHPTIGLVNYENKIKTTVSCIHENPLNYTYTVPNDDWIELSNYIQIASSGPTYIEGYSSIRNNDYTITAFNALSEVHTQVKTNIKRKLLTNSANIFEDLPSNQFTTRFIGEVSQRNQSAVSNFGFELDDSVLITRLHYTYRINNMTTGSVTASTVSINENSDSGIIINIEI